MTKHRKKRAAACLCLLLALLTLITSAGCGHAQTDRPSSDTDTRSPDGVLTLPPAPARTDAPSPVQTLPEPDTQPAPTDGHSWELTSLVTSSKETVPCAGVFRCTDCGKSEKRTVTPAELGAPMIMLEGTVKDGETVSITYASGDINFTCKASLSVQGATSAGFPKKNWTIKLFNDDGSKKKVRLADGWGAHNKYCLKANYVDFSQARNVVSGRLYGLVAASREADDDLSRAPNYGAVDGFPVGVWANGQFYGLYTMNIPKDEWMFAMNGGEDSRQAILMAGDWGEYVELRKTTSSFKHGWELEYCSTEDSSWVMPSFNKMIDFINKYDGKRFRKSIEKYTDVDRAIDMLLFTTLFHGNDNVAKNILWVTYDGEVWIPSVYDMDDSWGLVWNGQDFYSAKDFPFSEVAGRNVLWTRLWAEYRSEITARWKELRRGVLSVSSIKKEFRAFFDSVPDVLYQADAEKWPGCPSIRTSNYEQIADYVTARLQYLDKKIS